MLSDPTKPNRFRSAVALAMAALLLSACTRQREGATLPPPPAATPPAAQLDATATAAADAARAGPAPGSQQDMIAQAGADRVFFAFDQSTLDAQARATLEAQARWLQANPSVSVLVEGHADERGTREYNLALGERRANAAKNMLVAFGVAEGRMRVISYGKERLAEPGSDEAAHARNRRAVTVVVVP